ncbi:MAG TPA: DUF3159 domain-containing protein [Dermatophilaceae bacterium]|nr:DUF3159 domain-containing protein [Dermatophilaceae bacterium]
MTVDPRDGSAQEPTTPSPESLGVDRRMLDQAIGGWRGMIDSGLPAAVFVVAYLVTSQQLRPSVIAALVAGLLIALMRLARHESLQQVVAGFFGVAISAFVATRTGKAENYFLIGILINVAYMLVYAVSCLIRWPLLGVIVGYVRGDASTWRKDPRQYRAYATASWVWVAMFGLRLVIQLPMYFAGAVGMLGVAKLALGWPLFLLAAYVSYRIIHPVLKEVDAEAALQAPAPGLEPSAGLEPESA